MATFFIEESFKIAIEKLWTIPRYCINYENLVNALRQDIDEIEASIESVEMRVQRGVANGGETLPDVEAWMNRSIELVKRATLFLDRLDHEACCLMFFGDFCLCRCCNAKKAESLSKKINRVRKEGEFPGGVYLDPTAPDLGMTIAEGFTEMKSRRAYLRGLKAALVEKGKLVIGVYGEEGAGKTMLVRQFAMEMESDPNFAHVVYISNGRGVSTEPGLTEIQQGISERLGFDLSRKDTLQNRKMRVHERLSHQPNKVLIIIDHVGETFDYSLISIPWPKTVDSTCRIVIVSRNQSVFRSVGVQEEIKVEPLSPEEAVILYNFLATRSGLAPLEEYEEIENPENRISSRIGTWFPGQITEYVHLVDQMIRQVRQTPNSTLMIPAVAFRIEHSELEDNWIWSIRMEPKTKREYFLDIQGKAREGWLHGDQNYTAYFVYKLKTVPKAKGFDRSPVKFTIGIGSENEDKICYLDPTAAAANPNQDRPTIREDGWMEIEMGSFRNKKYDNEVIRLDVKDHDSKIKKNGLVIRGIELRAKS